ncbi:MAG TPA: hypothetical protein VFM34_13270 [Moraxellaceae bacterium]|nr:hypothetical protein [Moraxellaceae bacterium]
MPRNNFLECLQGLAPAALRKLSDDDIQRLDELVLRAHAQRNEEQAAAIEAAVAQVPVLLRDTLRRMLAE